MAIIIIIICIYMLLYVLVADHNGRSCPQQLDTSANSADDRIVGSYRFTDLVVGLVGQ